MKKLSKAKCNAFLRRYENGATVTIFAGGCTVNTFNIQKGFTFKFRNTDLLVYDPDGDFFDKYDLRIAKIYIKD